MRELRMVAQQPKRRPWRLRLPGLSRHDEDWDAFRARVVQETSTYLTEALRSPELGVRIPIVPADAARFPPSFTQAFWGPVLFET